MTVAVTRAVVAKIGMVLSEAGTIANVGTIPATRPVRNTWTIRTAAVAGAIGSPVADIAWKGGGAVHIQSIALGRLATLGRFALAGLSGRIPMKSPPP